CLMAAFANGMRRNYGRRQHRKRCATRRVLGLLPSQSHLAKDDGYDPRRDDPTPGVDPLRLRICRLNRLNFRSHFVQDRDCPYALYSRMDRQMPPQVICMQPIIVLASVFTLLIAPLGWWTALRIALAAMFLVTASAHWGKRRADLIRMTPAIFP